MARIASHNYLHAYFKQANKTPLQAARILSLNSSPTLCRVPFCAGIRLYGYIPETQSFVKTSQGATPSQVFSNRQLYDRSSVRSPRVATTVPHDPPTLLNGVNQSPQRGGILRERRLPSFVAARYISHLPLSASCPSYSEGGRPSFTQYDIRQHISTNRGPIPTTRTHSDISNALLCPPATTSSPATVTQVSRTYLTGAESISARGGPHVKYAGQQEISLQHWPEENIPATLNHGDGIEGAHPDDGSHAQSGLLSTSRPGLMFPMGSLSAGTQPAATWSAAMAPDLENLQMIRAYANRGYSELLVSSLVFLLCQVQPLVRRLPQILTLAQSLIGSRITSSVIKATVFKQFCGGERLEDVKRTLELLNHQGVGGILNYSAENACAPSAPTGVLLPSSLSYQLACQANLETIQCMDEFLHETLASVEPGAAVDQPCLGEAYIAVKISSMVDASLLARVSQLVHHSDFLWAKITESVPVEEAEKYTQEGRYTGSLYCEGVWKPIVEAVLSRRTFLTKALSLFPYANEAMLNDIFNIVMEANVHNNDRGVVSHDPLDDTVDYFQWASAITPEALSSGGPMECLLEPDVSPHGGVGGLLTATSLSAADSLEFSDFCQRLESVCTKANSTANVSVLLDAERYNVQAAIHYVSMNMMRRFNQVRTTVYSTYQCYLRESVGVVERDIYQSKRNNHLIGLKLVRGAYLHQETLAAAEGGYTNPVNKTIVDTHNSYDKSVEIAVRECKERKNRVLLGTHNKESTSKAIKVIENTFSDCGPEAMTTTLDLTRPDDAHQRTYTVPFVPVSFAQLLGMCDTMTVALAQSHLRVYKFVPWGGVGDVMPYLMRRVAENADMLSNSSNEVTFIMKEVSDRLSAHRCKALPPAPSSPSSPSSSHSVSPPAHGNQ